MDAVAEDGERSTLCPATRLYKECIVVKSNGSRKLGQNLQPACNRKPRKRAETVRGLGRVSKEWGVVCSLALLCICLVIPFGPVLAAQDVPAPNPAAPQPVPNPAQDQEKPEPEDSSKDKADKDQPPSSEKPQEPEKEKKEEKKDDTPNPAQAAAEKTKEVTIQAAEATKNLGTAALLKARDWEGGWLTGVYVEKGRPLIPMSLQQRREIYLEQTLTTPGAYMKRMFAAGIDQARGTPREWGGGIGGYSTRFASREGQFIAANSLAALANAKLKYEPRYDQCRCSGFWPRTRHAIMRNFLTYNQSEQQLRPQWGLYGGSFGGGLISTAWKPHPRNAFAEGGRAMVGQAGYGILLNIFIEFSTDLNRKIGARKR
jgi:hypothetical protein